MPLPDIVQEIGAYAGIAAVVGLAVLSALYFSQARDVKRLREWAGRAPERSEQAAATVPGRAGAPAAEPGARPVSPGPAPSPVKPPVPAQATATGAKPAAATAAAARQAQPATAGTGAASTAGAAAAGAGNAAPPSGAADGKAAPADGEAAKPAETAAPEAASTEAPAVPKPADAAPPAAPKPVGAAKPADAAPPAAATRPGGPATPAAQRPAGASPAVPPPPRTSSPAGPPRPSAARPASQPTQVFPPVRPKRRRPAARYIVVGVAGVLILGGAAAFGISQLASDDGPSPPAERAGSSSGDETTGQGAGEDRGEGAAVRPADVTVAVLNGTTVPGLAATLMDQVTEAGFTEGTIANFAPNQQVGESIVQYASGHERDARAVSRRLRIPQREAATPESRELAGDATVIVIAGGDQAP